MLKCIMWPFHHFVMVNKRRQLLEMIYQYMEIPNLPYKITVYDVILSKTEIDKKSISELPL